MMMKGKKVHHFSHQFSKADVALHQSCMISDQIHETNQNMCAHWQTNKQTKLILGQFSNLGAQRSSLLVLIYNLSANVSQTGDADEARNTFVMTAE